MRSESGLFLAQFSAAQHSFLVWFICKHNTYQFSLLIHYAATIASPSGLQVVDWHRSLEGFGGYVKDGGAFDKIRTSTRIASNNVNYVAGNPFCHTRIPDAGCHRRSLSKAIIVTVVYFGRGQIPYRSLKAPCKLI